MSLRQGDVNFLRFAVPRWEATASEYLKPSITSKPTALQPNYGFGIHSCDTLGAPSFKRNHPHLWPLHDLDSLCLSAALDRKIKLHPSNLPSTLLELFDIAVIPQFECTAWQPFRDQSVPCSDNGRTGFRLGSGYRIKPAWNLNER